MCISYKLPGFCVVQRQQQSDQLIPEADTRRVSEFYFFNYKRKFVANKILKLNWSKFKRVAYIKYLCL